MKNIPSLFGCLLAGLALAGCAGSRPAGLGVKEGRLAPCPDTPNCVRSQEQTGSHAIAPLVFAGDSAMAFNRLRDLLRTRADTTLVEEAPGYLRVEFRTNLGFVDDGEFLLDEAALRIHLRSAARLGYWDLGKNRRRLEEIRSAFNQGGAAP